MKTIVFSLLLPKSLCRTEIEHSQSKIKVTDSYLWRLDSSLTPNPPRAEGGQQSPPPFSLLNTFQPQRPSRESCFCGSLKIGFTPLERHELNTCVQRPKFGLDHTVSWERTYSMRMLGQLTIRLKK